MATGVVVSLISPYGIGGDAGRRVYLRLCMGETGWTPERPDTVWPWRPMTPSERASWPSSKAAIQEYEQDRADSIRRP